MPFPVASCRGRNPGRGGPSHLNIVTCTDDGTGAVLVTIAVAGTPTAGDTITIAGTSLYDGTWVVAGTPSSTTFTIPATYSADTSGGTWVVFTSFSLDFSIGINSQYLAV